MTLHLDSCLKRGLRIALVGALLFATGLLISSQRQVRGQGKSAQAEVTPADYLHWRDTLKNWGKWGPDDQRGVSNLITPAKSMAAARLVKTGEVVSLAHPVPQKEDPEVPASGVFHRTVIVANATNTLDSYSVAYHGLATSHMDAFCHFLFDGKMYNGYSAADNISPQTGCQKDDVMAWKDGVVTRAILYDIPGLKGLPYIEPGTPIKRADFEAAEKKEGVKAGPGDVILLYVGRWKRRAEKGPSPNVVAGYYVDVIPFIHDRQVAFIGHDFNIDWSPRPGWGDAQGIPGNPIHQAVLNWMGVGIIENLDLERAVETARRLHRYEFMITFSPLPVEGGTGSPINPLAIF